MTKPISALNLTISEAEVKKAVEDYLTIGQAQGHWLYLRLNSGELIAVAGETRRRIKLCPPGTADFVVFQTTRNQVFYGTLLFDKCPASLGCRVTFLEIKSSKGNQSDEQKAFEVEAKKMNCRYFVIRDADELAVILK